MTDGIGKIGGSNYGLGASFFSGRPEVNEEQQASQPIVQPETKDVNPDEIFEFIKGTGNLFVPQQKTEFTPIELSQPVLDRIANAINGFEAAFTVAMEEFGDESVALQVLDLMSLQELK